MLKVGDKVRFIEHTNMKHIGKKGKIGMCKQWGKGFNKWTSKNIFQRKIMDRIEPHLLPVINAIISLSFNYKRTRNQMIWKNMNNL